MPHRGALEDAVGEPVKVELLETPLKGDARCRFAIRIPKGRMADEGQRSKIKDKKSK